MANLSDPGASEGQQESSLDATVTTIQPLYSVDEIVDFAETVLYSFGFVSNVPILVVFFKQGFNCSTNIGFFSLALSDLFVCMVCIADFTMKLDFSWFHYRYFWRTFAVKEAGTSMSAWTTAVICWERLFSSILPEKVGSNTLNMSHKNSFTLRSFQVYIRSKFGKVSGRQLFLFFPSVLSSVNYNVS